MATRIHDLLELPASVHKGDFVQSLSGGISNPESTVASYAITPAIVHTFRHALSIVDSALKTGSSQAAYLHGSFGSGKSHFMAILDLMLANHAAPWNRPEFHPLKVEFDWVGQKSLLQLPMHFLGATSLEAQLFESYVRWAEAAHPDAALPALFADHELFANAASLRADLGDALFFDKLNAGRQVAAGWGELAQGALWDAERFEASVAHGDSDARAKLFSDLVKTHFPAFAHQSNRYIELDRGLQVMARHAKGLGYDGVILYLDELILWLAGHSSDLPFIQREVQKLVKLKEAQHDRRDIPIVSFIARQRDLAVLVGEQARGNERAALEDSFKHHGGRFEEVVLADSNLPAIVEHRVVRPKNAQAKAILADQFQRAWRSAGAATSTLIGSVGSEEAFRKVFPFSPALIEALVALSDCLQRERTAIRILMELLVEHLPELELGPIVPVGDAFDVIAGGSDPFDQVMRTRFNRARNLYTESFLPLIQGDHGTETAERCQRQRDDHRANLGCSGCRESACRNDNRLAKTLLMAALVPGAKPFQNLTVRRLVHLNHGVISTPIPGTEVNLAAEKVRRWGANIGALRIDDQADPVVHLHLEGIDLNPIVDSARVYDSIAGRKKALRELLFAELGLPPDTAMAAHAVTFRGIKRKGAVLFANVRELDDSKLRCPADADWYLVMDYPFDQGDHSPEDDVQRVELFREQARGPEQPTLVWLPTFFSHKLEQTLGDFVAITWLLDNPKSLEHLRPEDQVQARGDLRSLLDQKREHIKRALTAAYGLTSSDNGALDLSRSVVDHVLSLTPSLQLGALLAASLADGMKQIVERLLEHRYPHHPRFGATLTPGKLDFVRQLLERLVETPERRMPVSAADRKELQSFSDPLGLTNTTESHTMLQHQVLADIDQRREQAGLQAASVADVRGYADPQGYLGLTLPLQDLFVWLYTLWSGRTLESAGREVSNTKLGSLPVDAILIRPDLPTEEEWQDALEKGAVLFGVTFPNRHRSARNLSEFCKKLGESAAKSRQAQTLAQKLKQRLDDWGSPLGAPRYTTALSTASLVDLIERSDGADRIRQLAAYLPETSATAVRQSLVTTASVLHELDSDSRWLNYTAVKGLEGDPTKAGAVESFLEDLTKALRTDELNERLVQALVGLTQRASVLLVAPPRPDPVPRPTADDQIFRAPLGTERARSETAGVPTRDPVPPILDPVPPILDPIEPDDGWRKETEKTLHLQGGSNSTEPYVRLNMELARLVSGLSPELEVELAVVVRTRPKGSQS